MTTAIGKRIGRAIAAWVRMWADAVLAWADSGDRREVDPHGAADQSGKASPDGPPADWLAKVKRGAPQLLSSSGRRTRPVLMVSRPITQVGKNDPVPSPPARSQPQESQSPPSSKAPMPAEGKSGTPRSSIAAMQQPMPWPQNTAQPTVQPHQPSAIDSATSPTDLMRQPGKRIHRRLVAMEPIDSSTDRRADATVPRTLRFSRPVIWEESDISIETSGTPIAKPPSNVTTPSRAQTVSRIPQSAQIEQSTDWEAGSRVPPSAPLRPADNWEEPSPVIGAGPRRIASEFNELAGIPGACIGPETARVERSARQEDGGRPSQHRCDEPNWPVAEPPARVESISTSCGASSTDFWPSLPVVDGWENDFSDELPSICEHHRRLEREQRGEDIAWSA